MTIEDFYVKISGNYLKFTRDEFITVNTKASNIQNQFFIVTETGKTFCTIDDTAFYKLQLRLRGGKGGFSTLIRNEAMHKKRFTDTYNARDLKGRRVGDIKNEILLKKWLLQKEDPKEQNRQKSINDVKVNIDDCIKKGTDMENLIANSLIKSKDSNKIYAKVEPKVNLKEYLHQLKEQNNLKDAQKITDSNKQNAKLVNHQTLIINLDDIKSYEELCKYHVEDIKHTLKHFGAKIGGRPEERLKRLWDIKVNPVLQQKN